MDALGVVLVHWHLAKMMARSVKACLRDFFCCLYVYNLFNFMKILLNMFGWMGLCVAGGVAICLPWVVCSCEG